MSLSLNVPMEDKSRKPGYFFHGTESFLADQFIVSLRETADLQTDQEYNFERFHLEDRSWMEVIDLARTVPVFFSSGRIIVVDIAPGLEKRITNTEASIIKEYFSSPPSSQTVLVFVYPQKLNRGSALFKLFSGLPKSSVQIQELKPLNKMALQSWIEDRFRKAGVRLGEEARRRLVEVAGNDLRKLDNEILKILTYLGDRTLVELDDVNQITGWVRSFVEWEVSDALERADFKQTLVVLDSLLKKEGVSPLIIMGIVAKFFRELLLAKMWLQEKSKDRREIFKILKPQIQERYQTLYRSKFAAFFEIVDTFSMEDVDYFLEELGRIDLTTKTTQLSLQTLLEGFLFKYCRKRTVRRSR